MYAAKCNGRGRWEVFDREMGLRSGRRAALTADVREAWQRGEMFVTYQPIVEIPSGRLRGAEALVRWTHPIFGDVSPEEFVALAEEVGSIRRMGLDVMRDAVNQAARWRAEFVPDFYISVNVSPVQLDATLPDAIDEILASAGLDASALLVEITENVVLENREVSLRILEAIRARGTRIAIDDFGTGYSSLAYAQQLPVDLVKIDQSFTRDLDATTVGLVPTIMHLARWLGAAVVAEGVETIEQMHALVLLDCSLAQGYLYSSAVPAESFAAFVRLGHIIPSVGTIRLP